VRPGAKDGACFRGKHTKPDRGPLSAITAPGAHGLCVSIDCALSVDRVVVAKPLFDFFFLSGEYDALPFHHARTLTVFGHYVRTLVENFYDSVGLGPLEVIRRKGGIVFLHLPIG